MPEPRDGLLWDLFDAAVKAAAPEDPAGHLPNCGYTPEDMKCGCAQYGHRLRENLSAVLAKAPSHSARPARGGWTVADDIATHYCGQKQPHEAHSWQTPQVYGAATLTSDYQCAGFNGSPSPGPCWHDSGVSWPGAFATTRCELLAGHAGAHQADRGSMGGTAVWIDVTPPEAASDRG